MSKTKKPKSTKTTKSAKAPAKKTVAKKAPAKKTVAKKAPAKKTVAKKAPTKKTVAKKAPTKKTVAKKAPTKKTVAKKAPVKKSAAKTTKSELKSKVPKTTTKTDLKKKINKDLVFISGIAIVIVAIILFSVIAFSKANFVEDENGDFDLGDDHITAPDLGDDVIVPGIDEDDPRLLKLYEEAEEISKLMLHDLRDQQLDIFETWYASLNINKEKMDACLVRNNYLDEEFNFEESDFFEKLSEDNYLAQFGGVSGTPGIYVNSHFIPGYVAFDTISETIEYEINNDFVFDLESAKNYEPDAEKDPVFYLIYNQDFEEEINQNIEYLKANDDIPFFKNLFEEFPLTKVDYREEGVIDVINFLREMYEDLAHLPLLYIEGDISKSELLDDEYFNYLFFEMDEGFYILTPQAMPVTQQLLYQEFKTSNDYVIGSKDAKVSVVLFTDFTCSYCKLFETEVVPLIISNYVDSGKVNLIIKDLAMNQELSLFPTLFAYCAQEQDKFLETHTKLFNETDVFIKDLSEEVSKKYGPEMDRIQNEYEELMSN